MQRAKVSGSEIRLRRAQKDLREMSQISQIVIAPREKINFEKESLENTEADISSTPSPPRP
jgi:hypothetical protein